MRRVGPVALPTLEARLGVTCTVAAVADHVQDVLLGNATLQRPPLAGVIVRAVDVQVVVDADLNSVALPSQPE